MNTFLDSYFSNPNMNNQEYFISGMLAVLIVLCFVSATSTLAMVIQMSIYNRRRELRMGLRETLPLWLRLMDKVTAKLNPERVTL
jgi:hypothetical protein